MLKETGEKYPPPDNFQHLTTVMVNEEIWDLLSRKSRTVDLGFPKVQGPFMQGLSTLTILADRLLKDVKNSKLKTPTFVISCNNLWMALSY
jgi:hypothetical protein